jgi:hypothetical protein
MVVSSLENYLSRLAKKLSKINAENGIRSRNEMARNVMVLPPPGEAIS